MGKGFEKGGVKEGERTKRECGQGNRKVQLPIREN